MANNPVETGSISVDPMFFVPDGTLGLQPAGQNPSTTDAAEDEFSEVEGSEDSDFGFEDVPDSLALEDTDGGVEPTEALDTPSIVGVISQTIRTAPGGNQVVDVVIEVENILGASDYEYRIAKV